MHFLAFVIIPADGDPAQHVERLLAPYCERSDEADSFWDWYQIGGRWTGHLADYDPEADPANRDANGSAKWPTEWVAYEGDVQPVERVYAILGSPAGENLFPHRVVTSTGTSVKRGYNPAAVLGDWEAMFPPTPNYRDHVLAALKAALPDGRVVVVDYHS